MKDGDRDKVWDEWTYLRMQVEYKCSLNRHPIVNHVSGNVANFLTLALNFPDTANRGRAGAGALAQSHFTGP